LGRKSRQNFRGPRRFLLHASVGRLEAGALDTQTTCMTDPTSHPHATMGSTMPRERFTFLTEKKKAATCNVLLVPHATAPWPPPPIAAAYTT
jgi:hypothetical protein